jgi:hypothetical protein
VCGGVTGAGVSGGGVRGGGGFSVSGGTMSGGGAMSGSGALSVPGGGGSLFVPWGGGSLSVPGDGGAETGGDAAAPARWSRIRPSSYWQQEIWKHEFRLHVSLVMWSTLWCVRVEQLCNMYVW